MTTSQPLISIIVPIYNSETYLQRCLESIISQTYSHLEILLIDDGSTDGSGALCDRYAKQDNRIVVFHQHNQGSGQARNLGLDHCTGAYIGFVDSDDYIHPDMYKCLYEDISRFHTKLAICNCLRTSKDNEQSILNKSTNVKSKEEIIAITFRRRYWASWCKLAHRSLFDHVRFPNGLDNEDYPVTIQLLDQCPHIAENLNQLYFYYQRRDSISRSTFNIHTFDRITHTQNVLLYTIKNHPQWVSAAENVYITTLLYIYSYLISHPGNPWNSRTNEVYQLMEQRWDTCKKNRSIYWKQKVLLMMIHFTPNIYRNIILLKHCKN